MIANRIRKLRERHGMSQRAFAAIVPTSQQQVARIEKNGQDPGIVLGLAIAAALGAPPEEVFPAAKAAIKRAQSAGGRRSESDGRSEQTVGAVRVRGGGGQHGVGAGTRSRLARESGASRT